MADDSILQGIQVGSNLFTQALQNRQRQQAFTMEMASKSLELHQMENKMQLQVNGQAALTEFGQTIATAMAEGTIGDPATESKLWDIGARFPMIVGSAQWNAVLGQDGLVARSRYAKAGKKFAQDFQFQLEHGAPASEAAETALRQGLPELAPDKIPERVESLARIENARRQTEALSTFRERKFELDERKMTNEDLRIKLAEAGVDQREIGQIIKARELGYELQPRTKGQTPSEQPVLTPVERPPTTGTVSKTQQELQSTDAALSTLGDAISAIQKNPDAIGLRGFVGSLTEKAKGQFSPSEQVDTRINDTRQKASIAFANMAKSLRVDSGNMSRYELTKLEQAGDVLDWTEAPQTALSKLQNLKDLLVWKKLRQVKILRKGVPDSLLQQIQDADLQEMVREGLLSKDDARRWKNLKPIL
jgi:hypothetical protein